jgi:hypothetical protein
MIKIPNPRFKHYIWLAPESRAENKMSLILQWLLLTQFVPCQPAIGILQCFIVHQNSFLLKVFLLALFSDDVQVTFRHKFSLTEAVL